MIEFLPPTKSPIFQWTAGWWILYSQPDDDFRLIRNDQGGSCLPNMSHFEVESMDTWIPMNPQTCFFDSCDGCPRNTIQQSLLRFHILHTAAPLGPLAPLRRCFPSADEIRVKIGWSVVWQENLLAIDTLRLWLSSKKQHVESKDYVLIYYIYRQSGFVFCGKNWDRDFVNKHVDNVLSARFPDGVMGHVDLKLGFSTFGSSVAKRHGEVERMLQFAGGKIQPMLQFSWFQTGCLHWSLGEIWCFLFLGCFLLGSSRCAPNISWKNRK